MLRILCVECGSTPQLSRDVARILDVFKATSCQKLEATTSSQISETYPSPLINDSLDQVCTSESNNYMKSFLIQMGMKFQVPHITEDNILQVWVSLPSL
jgi:hypothetical protein